MSNSAPPGPPYPGGPSGPAVPPGPTGPPSGGADVASPSRPRRRAAWIVGGICALLALLLAAAVAFGAIWFFALRSTPQDAVEQYYEATESQDCESLQEVTTERFRNGAEFSCEAWEAGLSEEEAFEFEYEIGATTTDGDRASVESTELVTEPDGDRYRIRYTYDLVEQDGAWRIDGTTMLEEPEEI